MINEMPEMQTPAWLAAIDTAKNKDTCPFPLNEILKDSLYYPACGLNGTPVKFLAGNILSFVYVDYGVTREAFLQNLNGVDADSGFKGYHAILKREIFREDVVPSGWSPSILPHDQRDRMRLAEAESRCKPFGHWSVWKRDESTASSSGPERFSFFYMAGEISASYLGLYCQLGIAPEVIAIIQPGAMGGEWEQTTSDDSFFKQVVRSNPAGMPGYLLHGGTGWGRRHPDNDPYPDPCWREYRGTRLCQLPERYAGLWRLNNYACKNTKGEF